MEANNINAVRDALFATLKGLSDKENPMDIDRAKAVCDVSQAIINTAKLEVDFVRVTGSRLASEFIPTEEAKPLGLAGPSAIKTLRDRGVVTEETPGVTVHRMR